MGNRWHVMRSALAVVMLVTLAGEARASEDGLVFRAVGFFDAEASGSGGTCQVPAVDSGIARSSDTIGLSNTFGIPTTQYPDSVCQGWLELANMMTSQGINVESVDLRLRLAGAKRFRQFMPIRNGFPTACRAYRRSKVFSGAHLFAFGTDPNFGNTGSGAANIAFVNLFPMVNAQVMSCLQTQLGTLPPDVFVSVPLLVKAVATGRTDNGGEVRTNSATFTLTLLRLCGNGRIDFGEECDPNASIDACVGIATGSTCLPAGDPMECTCTR